MTMAPAETVPAVAWPAFHAELAQEWRQGEHVAIVGPTGRGKTTLALAILDIRRWVCIVATKPKDSTLAGLTRKGWTLLRSWPPVAGVQRVILWPRWRHRGDTAGQARAIRSAMDSMYQAGAWCLFLDDLQYIMDELRLAGDVTTLLHMARSLRVSLVLSTQRPRHVPVSVWNQATHLFIFGTKDHDDLRRLGGLGGLDARVIREAVAALGAHDVLYVNTRAGTLRTTTVGRG
jgi:hypothetical protein